MPMAPKILDAAPSRTMLHRRPRVRLCIVRYILLIVRAHDHIIAGMLILVLVLVLKDSLRTFFKVLVLVLVLGGQVLVLILVLGGSGPGGPCPCPGPCGLVLVLVLVFSPYKDLFPLFHYSDLFA